MGLLLARLSGMSWSIFTSTVILRLRKTRRPLRRLRSRRLPQPLILLSQPEVTGRFLVLRLLHSLELLLHLPRLVLARTGLLNQHPPPTTGVPLMPSQLSNGKFLVHKNGNSAFWLCPRVNLVSTHEGKI